MFEVIGKLTLGTEDSAIYIDGNSEVQTAFDDRGTVRNGGQLTMKNAVIMNSMNEHGYTGPIKVKKGGSFTMDGGRISNNTSYEKIDHDYNRPTSAGTVYVDPSASFTMNNGLIDNNNGGVTAYPKSELIITDDIIAGNRSGSGGGVAVSDQFLSEFSNVVNREYANTPADYEKHLKDNKAEANLNGGLIYKNYASIVPGLTEYNFYIKQDQNGFYTLYVPRLIIDGVPYDLFNVTKVEANKHGSYPKESFVEPQEESKPKVEVTNYDGPNHEIEFLKEWINGQDKVPEEITLVLTDKSGNKTEIKLTKKENWTKTLSDLEGLLKDSEYSVAEIELDDFTSEIEQGNSVLVIKGENKDGEEISFNYESKELNEALSGGNYRYRIFELEDKSIELNQENLDKFIRVEKQEDGSYIIYFADTVSLTEHLSIKAKNSYNPPNEPPEEPPVTPIVEEIKEEKPIISEKTEIVDVKENIVKTNNIKDNSVAPKTYDAGVTRYIVLTILSAISIALLEKKSKKYSKRK